MALGSAFFAVASGGICAAWIVTLPEDAARLSLPWLVVARLVSLPVFVACVVGVLFFGWGLIHFLGQLIFFWRPVLEIDPDGILDRASGVSVGFVPWEEIGSVEPYGVRGQRFVTIRVKNKRELIARQNPLKRLLIKANRRYLRTGEINIPLNVLAIPDDELAALFADHTGLEGGARETLSFGPDEGVPVERERPRSAGTRVPRIARSAARWTAVALLSLFYYAVTASLVVPGVMFAWNGIGPGDAPGLDRPLTGIVLLALGLLFFVFFPRLVKRLTGREVITQGYP